jgi:hypothetical protein
MNKQKARETLDLWQDRLAAQEEAYASELALMDQRELQYKGDRTLRNLDDGSRSAAAGKTDAVHVRNLTAECIEAQVDANIPQPKVTALRKEDEPLADRIESMLRNELDRMPFEIMNDMMARTVPIQGGGIWLIEWDNTSRTHKTVGEICVSALHPKQVIPQDGVYDKIEDMDYIFIRLPQTKEYISRRYGVSVDDEAESEPDVKGTGSESADMVTQYTAYYRNSKGGIGLFSWVNDTILDDLEDYQARRLRRCVKCGAVEPSGVEPLGEQTMDGTIPDGTELPDDIGFDEGAASVQPHRNGACVYCGSVSFEESEEEYEELYAPVMKSDGQMIIPDSPAGMKIPYYKPDVYPVILQRNVSIFGRFLGESDADKISDQQNATNIIHGNIIDKLLMGGSYMLLPNRASIKVDADRKKVIRIDRIDERSMFDTISMEEPIEQDMAYLQQLYEEARQAIGITDSFQGRKDSTATSGKAKEFAAAQSAGRLESKRVMKDAAFAQLFEAMFKFRLAYADEPRPVVSQDIRGRVKYGEFNRYDFLERDEAGEWYWNDRFLFSCDTSAPLASNREAMWQENRMNLQTGAYGNPQDIQTQILFWTVMEQLHYPLAGQAKEYLEGLAQQQAQQQAQAAAMQQAQQAQAAEAEREQAVLNVQRQAREDAEKARQVHETGMGVERVPRGVNNAQRALKRP